MEDTDTTTARRSLKPPPTTCPLSPPSTSPSKSNTPAPSRPVSTNPSTCPSSAAKTSLKNVPSPFSVEDSTVTVAKCVAGLGEPACQKVELTLPKQVCVELVYGYAHEPAPAAPAYAPAAEE